MKQIEKFYLIISNLALGAIITVTGFEMLPVNLHNFWIFFQLYLWVVSPIIVVLTLGREKDEAHIR